MFIIYDLIFIIFILIYLPIYLFKGKFHKGFLRRLGSLPEGLVFNEPIWIHAVSVGEVMAMRELISELRREYPLKMFVISTVTPTGNKIANTIAQEGDFVTYLPLDLSFILKRVIKRIKPCVFIIAETEIWPNLITSLYKSRIPIAILNARISDSSFKGYSAVKFLLKPVLDKVSIFCAQSGNDSFRLNILGAKPLNIAVTGNMKFDQVPSKELDPVLYRQRLGLKSKERLLIAGSTHPGEEIIILNAYRLLLNNFPELRLLIAPRHPERADEVKSLADNAGFQAGRISLMDADALAAKEVFILDTVGELKGFYSAADIVFVGGSLVKRGGQNILEPAGAGKPVIFGPYMFNFRDIAQVFLEHKAAIEILDRDGLVAAVSSLLDNNLKAERLVKNAREVISHNQGATKRNIKLIGKFIEGSAYGY